MSIPSGGEREGGEGRRNPWWGGGIPSANLGSLALRRPHPQPSPSRERESMYGVEGEDTECCCGGGSGILIAPGGDDGGPRRAGRGTAQARSPTRCAAYLIE